MKSDLGRVCYFPVWALVICALAISLAARTEAQVKPGRKPSEAEAKAFLEDAEKRLFEMGNRQQRA
jgi:hypothetical protein